MDIAIQSQMINLIEDKVFFKNIGLIKGTYDKEKGIFIDEYGTKYYDIGGDNPYAEHYFCYPNSIEDLQEIYPNLKNDKDILKEYLNELMEVCFIGYFDPILGAIKLMKFNLNEIQNVIVREEYGLNELETTEETVQIDFTQNQKFIFDIKSLNALKNYNSMEELRDYIDKLISVGDYVEQEEFQAKESNDLKPETEVIQLNDYKK